MKRKTKLTKLKITEVSGVDNPANPGAHIAFWKRDNETNGDNDMDVQELAKKLEEITAQNAELAVMAKMSDAEKDFMAKMKDEDKKEFMAMDAEKRKEAMKKSDESEEAEKAAAAADSENQMEKKEMSEKETEAVSKADFEAVQKANKELADKVAKMEAEKAFDAFIAKASKQVPSLASEAKVDFAKALFAMPQDQQDAVLKELVAAEKIKSEYMIEKGTSARNDGGASEQLEKLTKSHMEANKVSFSDAMLAVTSTPEGAALYKQTLAGAN